MDSIKEYFISITACTILCSMITGLFEKNNSSYKIIKMLCGAFVLFTLIRPITEIQLDEIALFVDTVSENAQAAISTGENYRIDTIASIIKEETEAYILDKAQALHCTLDVEVIVEKTQQPFPKEVYITGKLSSDEKRILQQMIEEDLRIAKENQIWIQ